MYRLDYVNLVIEALFIFSFLITVFIPYHIVNVFFSFVCENDISNLPVRYLDYLSDYQKQLALNVQFNTEISNIRREPCESSLDGHILTMVDQHGWPYKCGYVHVLG